MKALPLVALAFLAGGFAVCVASPDKLALVLMLASSAVVSAVLSTRE